MLTNIKTHIIQFIALAFALTTLSAIAVMPAVGAADANIDKALCAGANLDVNTSESCEPDGDAANTVNDLVATIINIFSWVVGVVAVIMIIIGGFRYITSNGDSGNVTGAKNTILYAIVGLVIVALAQFIVKFVLAKTTEATN